MPCLILRIGFVGEVGYEIHFPAAYGEHLWDALLEAGRPHGIRPFGLEPQRILRLQKMHILVGQDTDSESTPFGAAMPWIVKLDKEQDFIGKWALEHYGEEPAATSLVGFTMADGYVPTEGAVVTDGDGTPAGQVTSSRYSPVLDRVIGMAWVPAALAEGRRPDHDLRRGTHHRGAGPDQAVLRPRGRGAALVSLEFLSAGAAAAERGRAQPDGAPGPRGGRAVRAARRMERRRRLRLGRAGVPRVREHRRLGGRLAPGKARVPGARDQPSGQACSSGHGGPTRPTPGGAR